MRLKKMKTITRIFFMPITRYMVVAVCTIHSAVPSE
jgi:hypothetical protein